MFWLTVLQRKKKKEFTQNYHLFNVLENMMVIEMYIVYITHIYIWKKKKQKKNK